jgi:hypothetical protein
MQRRFLKEMDYSRTKSKGLFTFWFSNQVMRSQHGVSFQDASGVEHSTYWMVFYLAADPSATLAG